jgi:teichuronic acid biosynthesis glycosyltransferase TuaC
MRVLVVTTMWPNNVRPLLGANIRAQVMSVAALGVEHVVLVTHGGSRVGRYARLARAVTSRLHTEHFDLVHAHYGFSGIAARAQSTRPLVVTFHGNDLIPRTTPSGRPTVVGRFERVSSRALARYVDRAIVVSPEMAEALSGVPCEVIPVGVDLSRFHPLPREVARARLGLPTAGQHVLFAGDPSLVVKRFGLAQEAIELVRQRHPEVRLTVVSGKTPDEMPLWLNAADVLVLTSISEGSPVIVKEALACELPVVSVPVGDVAKRIAGALHCSIADPTPDALAAALRRVLEAGERASNGREVIDSMSSVAVARRIVAVYEQVVAASRPAHPDADH